MCLCQGVSDFSVDHGTPTLRGVPVAIICLVNGVDVLKSSALMARGLTGTVPQRRNPLIMFLVVMVASYALPNQVGHTHFAITLTGDSAIHSVTDLL